MTKLGGAATAIIPGLALCLIVTGAAMLVQLGEERMFQHPYVEALVLAILLGTAIRSVWRPGERWRRGIAFSAKQLLEIAVMLLGATISLRAVAASGPALLAGIALTVVLTVGASYGICRLFRLPVRMAILIACGNAICGNSAIAAVAPVIGAKSDDVAASISFTAVLGVLMVIGLPLAIPLAGYSPHQYGVLAGLTVYAVPQVLAATAPAGALSTQVGTLVKLVRVLMLGPVVVAISVLAARLGRDKRDAARAARPGLAKLVPWFIVGFLLLALARSLGLVPDLVLGPLARVAGVLTIVSMAALGLGVDVRVLGRVGGRVTASVTLSLVFLVAISIGLIGALGIR